MANTYDIGDKVRLSAAFTVSSVATDPTTITFKIKNPLGVITSYVYGTDAALVKDNTGNYHVDFTITVSGWHLYRFASTGTVVTASEGSFEARESNF